MDTTAELGEDKPRHYGRSSIQKVAAWTGGLSPPARGGEI